jgi:hypothetical protein
MSLPPPSPSRVRGINDSLDIMNFRKCQQRKESEKLTGKIKSAIKTLIGGNIWDGDKRAASIF